MWNVNNVLEKGNNGYGKLELKVDTTCTVLSGLVSLRMWHRVRPDD